MKNVIIAMLTIVAIVAFISVRQMSERASYWMQRTVAAEAVIDKMADNDEDYFLDVVMESDEYMEWYNLGGNQ